MNGQITILVDNRAEQPFVSEHGLSILLEIEQPGIKKKRVLFDTGQGDALFQNAKTMGISLKELDALVLSHGHYDHGGNIAQILSMNPSISFFAHPDCLISRFSMHPGKAAKSVALSKDDKTA
jgi:7,8-dihydropterin-6-yl-methyl-4-(beta-D-ribofuranosyl)aminobenzene 5'-phosphate synthase